MRLLNTRSYAYTRLNWQSVPELISIPKSKPLNSHELHSTILFLSISIDSLTLGSITIFRLSSLTYPIPLLFLVVRTDRLTKLLVVDVVVVMVGLRLSGECRHKTNYDQQSNDGPSIITISLQIFARSLLFSFRSHTLHSHFNRRNSFFEI